MADFYFKYIQEYEYPPKSAVLLVSYSKSAIGWKQATDLLNNPPSQHDEHQDGDDKQQQPDSHDQAQPIHMSELNGAGIVEQQPTHNNYNNICVQQQCIDNNYGTCDVYGQPSKFQSNEPICHTNIDQQPICKYLHFIDDNTADNGTNGVNIYGQHSYSQPVMIASPEPSNDGANRIKELEEEIKKLQFALCSKNDDKKEENDKKMIEISQDEQICYWYNNKSGCREGRKCKFIHETYANALRQYATKCYHNKDVNIQNIGIYLKNSLDGYDKMNDKGNPGYIKFGTYSRTFCEVLCNYVLKEGSLSVQTLYSKIKLLKYHKNFPTKSMNVIRLNTNKIIHGVRYNENAKKRFICEPVQHSILVSLYNITWWVFQNYLHFIHL